MTVDEGKLRAKSNDRSVPTNGLCPGTVVPGSRLIAEMFRIEPRPSDCIENHDRSTSRYSRYARHSAGNDNCCDADQSCGRRNPRPSNAGRTSWDDGAGGRSSAPSPVFRDQGVVQSGQPVRARVPVPCPCSPELSEIHDRPVDLVESSRSRTPNRCGVSPARTPLDDRRDTYDARSPTCGDQNARRCDYDVEPEPQNCSSPRGGRRGTYNVPQNDRRGTYDVPQNDRRGTYDVPQNDRRGTYDVSRPCAALRNDRQSTGRSEPSARESGPVARNLTVPFSMTGTIQLSGFDDRSSRGRLHDTDGDIDDFLDNHLDYDMVAPRAVALPGQPYVHIDESAANRAPENWRMSMHDRSSAGAQSMGIPGPRCDDERGCRSRDASADRQSRPFGLNDSFAASGQRDRRRSRARSAASACGSRLSGDDRRHDAFDRTTR